MSAKKLSTGLEVDFIISVRGEENGNCEVSIKMNADNPQIWIMETLLNTMEVTSEKLKEVLNSLNN